LTPSAPARRAQLCGNSGPAKELHKWLFDWREAIKAQEEEERAQAAAGGTKGGAIAAAAAQKAAQRPLMPMQGGCLPATPSKCPPWPFLSPGMQTWQANLACKPWPFLSPGMQTTCAHSFR